LYSVNIVTELNILTAVRFPYPLYVSTSYKIDLLSGIHIHQSRSI